MIFQNLASFPVALGAPLFIGTVVLISVGGGLLFHRYVPRAILAEHNDIAGFVFAVVGVVYAVLLAFFAVGVWERFEGAEERTYEEAGRLTVVYRKVDLYPQEHVLRAELRRYVELIVGREWLAMEQGAENPAADALAERIAYQVRHLPVSSMAQQNVHAAIVQSMDEALVDRDFRTSLGAIGINGFLWGILICGAVATIFFAYLFAYRNPWSLVSIVGVLALMLALVLYLVAAVAYPFRGEIRVDPDAFVYALATFDKVGP